MIKKVGITVKYSVLGYLIGEGFGNLFKNKKSTIASLMIMCATMFVFGIFFLIGENVQAIMAQVEEQQAMQVFIEFDTPEEEIAELGNKIKAIQYVNTAEMVTKEDALNEVKSWLKDSQYILDSYAEENPFKASYVVTLTDLTKISEVEAEILTFENVSKITLRDDTVNTLINIVNGIRTATAVILVLLILISIFIISNTIKLTVHARRKEISIMKYVGATNGFIRWPFMVEGIIIGVISALISVLFLGLAYNFVTNQVATTGITQLIQINLLQFADMFNVLLIVYLTLGIGIGAIGSAISMKRYLEV